MGLTALEAHRQPSKHGMGAKIPGVAFIGNDVTCQLHPFTAHARSLTALTAHTMPIADFTGLFTRHDICIPHCEIFAFWRLWALKIPISGVYRHHCPPSPMTYSHSHHRFTRPPSASMSRSLAKAHLWHEMSR